MAFPVRPVFRNNWSAASRDIVARIKNRPAAACRPRFDRQPTTQTAAPRRFDSGPNDEYLKLIDFKDTTSDCGLYVFEDHSSFYGSVEDELRG
jgi:hypothetical protein